MAARYIQGCPASPRHRDRQTLQRERAGGESARGRRPARRAYATGDLHACRSKLAVQDGHMGAVMSAYNKNQTAPTAASTRIADPGPQAAVGLHWLGSERL